MAPVRGKVTFDGKPVAYGSIMFQHESGGQPAAGEIKQDGTYELETFNVGTGARVGKNLVRITSFEGNDPSRKLALPTGEPVLGKSLIPAKYGSFGGSGLSVEVQAEGEQTFDFELKK